MSDKPLISIIIPTYNRAHLIGETLDSVLAQTYSNWECIVVDDGSTDDTAVVVNRYKVNDTRFKFYNRPDNRPSGGNAARNFGFEKAKGIYVQWFDSDDIMCPDYLSARLTVFQEHPKSDVVFCAFTYFDDRGMQNRVTNGNFSGAILDDLIEKKISFSPLSYLLRKDILLSLNFDEHLKRAQDLDFFFKVFTSSNSITIKHVKKTLFKVRKHNNAISSKPEKSGAKLNSRFIVNTRILSYFYSTKNTRAITLCKQQCLLDLKRLLNNHNFSLVVHNIITFKYFTVKQKLYLLFCGGSQFIFKRGAHQFSKLKV